MDLAKAFAAWRNQPPDQWLALVNRVLPPVAVVALVIFLAFQAAGLTWRLLEQPPRPQDVPPAVLVATASLPRSGGNADLSALAGSELFGKAPQIDPAAIRADNLIDARETQLDLQLIGVAQHQELPERGSMVIPEAGTAIIAVAGGAQKLYHTGEAIGTTNVRLHSVFVDRVMLETANGEIEKLSFPDASELAGLAGRAGAGTNRSAQTQTMFRAPQATGTPAATVENVTNAAALFSQHVQLRMRVEGENVIGFGLEPRNDSPVLSRLGLEPGDVLTEVNGVRLSDLRNATAVVQALQQSPQANVKVRRNGVDLPMTIDMSQIARLAESLQ